MRRVVVVPVALVLLALSASTPVAANVSLAELERAREFRSFHGFRSTTDTLIRAAGDEAAFPDRTWGVALTSDEATEMQRRIALMERAAVLVEPLSSDVGWAGWWIDQQAGGVPVFQFVGDPGEARSKIEAELGANEYRIGTVMHSYRDLSDLMEALSAASDELVEGGIPITGVALNVRSNTIRVSLDPLTEKAKAYLLDRYGGPMIFDDEPVAEADSGCISGCLPLKGGIGIAPQDKPLRYCTSGYMARRADTDPDKLQFVTAGHCVEFGSPYGPWLHGSTSVGNSPTGGGNYMETYFDHSDGDVGLVTVSTSQIPTIKNEMLVGYNPTVIYRVQAAPSWSEQPEGMDVCRMGRTTGGPQCGHITDESESKRSIVKLNGVIVGNWWIDFTKVYSRDADLGDSGGPIYYIAGGSSPYVALLGTHVDSQAGYVDFGGSGWYTTWDKGRDQLEASFSGLDLAPCFTTSCALN